MNCKPGDLAIIVKAGGDEHCMRWIGRVITVRLVAPHSTTGRPCWTYEGPPLIHPVYGECMGVADECLRPITPPPGSVTDDEVRELYEPRELVYVETRKERA